MNLVHRPHPAAPTIHDIKSFRSQFNDSLDALLTKNIDKAPYYMRPVLHAARIAGAALKGRPRTEILAAVNQAGREMLYKMQMEPYPCPRCKHAADPECTMCDGRQMVQWHGDFGGGPR